MLTEVISKGTDLAVLDRPSQKRLDLSLIIPTRNEAGNISPLLSKIDQALKGMEVEVLFVDDSTDETPQAVETAKSSFPGLTVRLLHRSGADRTGGLGGAVLLGLQNAQSDYACVMDADLQHPPELLGTMLAVGREKNVDLVVATRRKGKSKVDGLSFTRNMISHGLDLIARIFYSPQLRGVSDPLSGFFLVRVKALDLSALRPNGFKILLEILVRNPTLSKAEVPFHFGERLSGKSKASTAEAFNYLKLLWGLKSNSSVFRLTAFALVGASGILINTLVLYLVTARLNIYYMLSIIIATAASTTWNFALTEGWVYRASLPPQGRLRRFVLFSLMNVAALALRSPIIYILTSLFGIHYVVSNLITLVLLTGIRFLTADSIIWGWSQTKKATGGVNKYPKAVMGAYAYNIHNLVTVMSEGELPELEPFQVHEDIKEPTIRVRIGIPPSQKDGSTKDRSYLRFREIFGHVGFEVGIWMGEQVNVIASPLLRYSPHVLYTNIVEPILRWTFVKKGYALVHGATIAFGNEAFIITARTDTGKTTTLLKILSHQRRNSDRAAFLSDDMTIISPDGTALTYPKPLTISAHTLGAINADTLKGKEKAFLPLQSRIHSRTGRKVATFINKTLLPAATINMFMQMVVPPPKYFVSKLLPKVKLSQTAHYAGMFIIERGGNGITSMKNEEALEVLLRNCDDAYGFPPYDNLKEFLYQHNGVDLRQIEQQIIRQAFNGLQATLIQSQKLDWWCLIPTFINEQMANDCTCDEPRLIPASQVNSLHPLSGD